VSREHLAKIKSPLDQLADPAPPTAPPSVVSPFDELPTR
jgi:hypothetical protein